MTRLLLATAALAGACGPVPHVTSLDPPSAPGTESADAALAVDPGTGDLLLAWVAGDTTAWHVYFARSFDGGASWSSPARVTEREYDVHPHGESSPRLVAAPGVIAIVWVNSVPAPGRKWPGSNIRFARSTDDGRTWSRTITLNDDTSAGPRGHLFHGAAWRGDSGLVVAWMDERGGAAPGNTAAETHGGHHTVEAEEPDATIYLATSSDGGARWDANRAFRGAACPCCRVALARDPAGAVVAGWRKHFPGNVRDVVVAALDAPGEARVHADNWMYPGCPHTGPGLAIDSSGGTHVAWFSGVPGAAGVYYARAAATGAFETPVRLVGAITLPAAHPRVAAFPHGSAVVVWDVGPDGRPALHVAHIASGGRLVSSLSVPASGGADHPEVAALADGRVVVAWTERHGDATAIRMISLNARAAPRSQ